MAPGYRTTATNTRRGNRSGFAEHDDFEGLPVRQWRQQMVTIAPPPEREENKKHDRWAQELPHGMPRDTPLLTPHNQELLRLARSGKLYRKRPLPEEDDADADGIPGDKQEKKESAASEGYSYKVKKWVRLDRSAEDAGINHLAPRQKGTITRPSRQLGTQVTGPMVTKATVKRVDAAGNPYTQEVIIPDGQAVDGEIISTSVVPAPEATGEAALSAATPMRRKPPIPQKKKGRGRGGRAGRGRGRLPLATPSRPIPQQDGTTELKPDNVGPDGVKIEAEDGSRNGGDIEMNESSALDDEDGDEGSGDDDEGDGDESGTPAAEGEDQEMKDAPSYTPSDSAVDAPPVTVTTDAPQPGANLVPPPLVTESTHLEGSPLKNVTLRSPTDPSPHLSPIATTAAPVNADTGLSEVPGESTLGLQPSVPEPQQEILLSQAFFRENPVDNQPAEPAAPVPAETAPTETTGMEGITSTTTESEMIAPEPIPDQPVVQPVAVESAPVIEPPPVVEPPAVIEPPPVVEAPLQTQELPIAPPKEDVPLPSSEEPMPGQAPETSDQQIPAVTEPAPPSPIIAPVPAPAPSPPSVEQVPVEEVIGGVGADDIKAEDIDSKDTGAEGVGAVSVEDVIIEDAGAANVGAEDRGDKDAEVKDIVGADDTRADDVATEHVGIENVGTEDVGTEDVATEDGSFDILGSLSTSLNQQAEDDAPPPPSLPTGLPDTATAEPAQTTQLEEVAHPVQPAQPDETGLSGQTVETGETTQTGEPAETADTEAQAQAQAQALAQESTKEVAEEKPETEV
ncbi:hypothetical protein J7T55_011942 [Diaporthe amygdali]|uniref:uncharacterized protein n=1 Tax=Phomopsis amygdali TaxID=1214568 RepID=UPI0022FE2D40|nr:uncharacterized protein J7T55_011942 [Diaporthe amygdali]KAJ0123477.1 hypothetical protein J7T55_011942 [Diaporthe amygdali]